ARPSRARRARRVPALADVGAGRRARVAARVRAVADAGVDLRRARVGAPGTDVIAVGASRRARRARRDAQGFVAVELAASVAVLLVPVVLLVAGLPTWSERRHAATVAAHEGAREAAAEWPAVHDAVVIEVARLAAANLGVPPGDVAVRV